MASYGWIVTKDLIFDPEISKKDRVGVMGPRGIRPEIAEALRAGEGVRWRALDDDNNAYYEGLYIGPDDETLFGPLNDFAMPDAGATDIQYWQSGKGGGWKTL
jgi:hypothetical protein